MAEYLFSPIKSPSLPHPQRIHSRGGEGTQYSVWLVVRATIEDQGSRPLSVDAVFWESPDIWVEGPLGVNLPKPGEPHTVWARICNFGMKPAHNVTVRFWWSVPTPLITESDAHLIDELVKEGPIDPEGGSLPVAAAKPWVPVFENEGHECLLVEAWIDPSDPLPDAPVMNPLFDRHVGQRNVTIKEIEAGGTFSLDLLVPNVLDKDQDVVVQIERLNANSVESLLRQSPAWRSSWFDFPRAPLELKIALPRSDTFMLGDSRLWASRIAAWHLGAPGSRAAPSGPTLRLAERFRPFESRRLTIEGRVPSHTPAGALYAYRVSQQLGGLTVGGYTLCLIVPGHGERGDQSPVIAWKR